MPDLVDIIEKTDHVRGRQIATVTFIMYADFESVDCSEALPLVHALLEEFGMNIRLVFRHFPRRDVHPHAELAAEAAEAAGSQGRFWGMHDLLFANQDDLHASSLIRYAYSLGLDVDTFARELVGRRHREKVMHDMQTGWQNGVRRPPTFFVNGARMDAPFSYDSLQRSISKAIRRDAELFYAQ